MNRPIRLLSLLLAVGFLLPTTGLGEEPLDSYEELCQKGRQQLVKGHFDKAIDHYSDAIGEEPSKPLAFVSRAIVYCAMNQYENAEADSQKAVALDEKNVDAHLVLGSTLRLMKQYDDAEKIFRNVIYELDERSADAYAGRGKLYLDMQDDEGAERDFSKALSLNPKLEHVYIERAAICRRNEEFGQAIRDYSSVIDDLRRDVPQYYFLRAQVRLADKRYDEALEDARIATKEIPDYVAAYGIQVAALFHQEKYDEADAALKQAEYHAETEPGVLLWRGRLLAAEEKYEEALAKYEQALEADPDFLPALESSIEAYQALEAEETIESLQAKVEQIEEEQEKRAKDERLLWLVVRGIPGASRDLTDDKLQEIAAQRERDELAKQLARQFAEEVRKNTRSLQKDCQEIEIAQVVPDQWRFAEAIVELAGKRFDEEAYEIAAADFKQGEIRYNGALQAYEDIVSKDHSLWKKWAFERADDMDDDFAPVMTWMTLAETCHAMGDQDGYQRAIGKAMMLIDSGGLLNPYSGCSLMLRVARLRIECDDLEGAREAMRAAADFSEGVSNLATRAASLAQCAGLAIRCDERDRWPTYLSKAVQAAEQADFSLKEYRTRHVNFVKHCAYVEARATEEAFSYAQNVEQVVSRSGNDSDVRWNADVYAAVALTAMRNGCSTAKEKRLFETSYLKSVRASVTKVYGRDFAIGARYVLASSDAVGDDYVRAWCGAMILADPSTVSIIGGRAIRGACQQGRLDDARTMYEALLESYPSAAAVRHLADAEVRLGMQSFVQLRHWVHDMPQDSGRAAAMIGLAAGVKNGRVAADEEVAVDGNGLADDSPAPTGDSTGDLDDVLTLHAGGNPDLAMQTLAELLKGSRKKKQLLKTFDTVALDASAWWLEEATRRIGEVESPCVRAALWLQIAKTYLASGSMDGYRDTLAKIDSCWIAMWSRIYTRRCPPNTGNDGRVYWEFDHDLEETEADEIRAMLQVLFDIETIQTDLGEPEEALETLLLAARCAELMPRKTGSMAALSPSYTSLWLKRVGGRLKLRGREDLAAITTGPSPASPGMRKWPINWYTHSLASFEAQDLVELERLAQVSEERSHSGSDFIYSARLSALLALAAAREGDTNTYRQAAMRAASLMRRENRTLSTHVLYDLARAAVAADMPEIARQYVKQAGAHYEDRDMVLAEISQGLAEQGDLEDAEEVADDIRGYIPHAVAQQAIFFVRATESKDNLSEVYLEIEDYHEPSDQAAAYAAVAAALIAE